MARTRLVLISLLSLFIWALIISCDSESPAKNDDDDKEPVEKLDSTFDIGISEGDFYEYRNAQNEKMTLRARTASTEKWAPAFWDTINLVSRYTIPIEQKVFEGDFPRLYYFGITETDSGFYFGARKHYLISKEITLDFYVPVFYLPKKVNDGVFKNFKILSYNGTEYNSIDSVIVKVPFAPDITEIEIHSFAKRIGFREGIWEQIFYLENGKGFRRFWEYNRTDSIEE